VRQHRDPAELIDLCEDLKRPARRRPALDAVACPAENPDRRKKSVDIRRAEVDVEDRDQVDSLVTGEVVELDRGEDGEIVPTLVRGVLDGVHPSGRSVVSQGDSG
jgi:hypothetical protein